MARTPPARLRARRSRTPAATAYFGYVNAFEFDAQRDLSEHFRFNFGIEADGVDTGLLRFNIGATIVRDDATRVSLHLNVNAGEGDRMTVTTTSIAEHDLTSGLTLLAEDELDKAILSAKTAAKDTFFSFVTTATMELMGAVHERADS